MIRLLLLLTFPLFCFGRINGPGDVQFWQRVRLNTKATERLTFKFSEETRFGDDVSKFYFSYLQLNTAFKIRNWLSFEPGYRQTLRRSPFSSSTFRFEYDPLVDVVLKYRSCLWQFVQRSRVQLLVLGSNQNWLYRALFRVRRQIECVNLSFYLENEFFFREFSNYHQNRTTFGLSKIVYDFMSLDCFYIARLLKNNNHHWVYNNIFGFNLNFTF